MKTGSFLAVLMGLCVCATVASAQPRGAPGRRPVAATARAPASTQAPTGAQAPTAAAQPLTPAPTFTGACGIPGQEATCARVSRLVRLAASEAATGTCDGLVIAERACTTLLHFVDDLCRLSTATSHTEGSATQSTAAVADGTLSNSTAAVQLHPEIQSARRFCAWLVTTREEARGETAPNIVTACAAEPDEAADDMGVAENAIGSVTISAAREQAQAGLVACAQGNDGDRHDDGGPSVPPQRSTPRTQVTAGQHAVRALGFELSLGGGIPLARSTYDQISHGYGVVRVGATFRLHHLDLALQGILLIDAGRVSFVDREEPQTLLGGGILLQASYGFDWSRFSLRAGVEVGWVYLDQSIHDGRYYSPDLPPASQRAGHSPVLGAFMRPEYALYTGERASLHLFAEVAMDYIPLGWLAGNDFADDLHVRILGGARYAFDL